MKMKYWIVGSGLLMLLSFGGRALWTGQDIPGNIQAMLLLIISGGLASDPITEGVKRLGNPSPAPAKNEETPDAH